MRPTADSPPAPIAPAAQNLEPLASVHTSNFPALLDQLGISLAVTTYQAGRLVFIRSEGDHLNTHFRTFDRPMGMATLGDRLAVGCGVQVWEFRDNPAVAAKVEPVGRHDACYLPRRSHVTGDIDVHEMEYSPDGKIWLINTRFSCLCNLRSDCSFAPYWRPPFVTALAPEDRCHLNGLALVDGVPRYATALGTSNIGQRIAGEVGKAIALVKRQTNSVHPELLKRA
ncbi:MAG: TIGR03032 family protein [Gemmataceae bacterium]|nr:TIGR03032 family protein [Gemmataceae bacterium]